jgi:small subunit ribosomal protein S21
MIIKMCRGNSVEVRDNFEKAIRKFKKNVQESGVLEELRKREQYTKPSEERKKLRNLARRRWERKLRLEKLPRDKF